MASPDERPGEECGVVAAVRTDSSVTGWLVDGLHALQHRGQESAGIAVVDDGRMLVIKDVGLVADVLSSRVTVGVTGLMGIGHTRYSTTGASSWENAQPLFLPAGPGREFAMAHNGNVVGFDGEPRLSRDGDKNGSAASDTLRIASMISEAIDSHPEMSLADAVEATVPRLDGGYCIVACDPVGVVAARDPNGFRPLCLGRTPDGWVVASESAALDVIGARLVREIEPGEIIEIRPGQSPVSRKARSDGLSGGMCVLEFVYLARPDSVINGIRVNTARVRMGRRLAETAPVDADVVVGVPESGLPIAEGFSALAGIPLTFAVVKDRYTGRSFIAPTQEERERAVRRKLNVLPDQVAGKRIVVVDDSVIRGTVTRHMVSRFRAAGAAEVHLRVALPPVRWPCVYGMDFGPREGLLATDRTEEQMAEHLGVDSIGFLTVDDMVEAIDPGGHRICAACITGEFPTPAGAAVAAEWASCCKDEKIVR